MSFSQKWASVILVIVMSMPLSAQPPAPPADAARGGQTEEAAQANALYQAQNLVGALPLYEDLHKRHPNENLWRERLAMCVLSSGTTDAERKANRERARGLLMDAKNSGDNSNLVQVLLEKLDQAAAAPQATGPVSPGADALRKAEKAFTSGDLPGAMKLYQEAMTADPKLYEAPLFAGDSEYKMGHYTEAGEWYAKAIAINPNRETAYRYWGDCLMKAGKAQEAEGKFIDAIIAEPYTRAARIGLKQWADQTKTPLVSPAITLSARAVPDADGKTNIMVDGSQTGNPMSTAMIAYSIGATVFRNGGFSKAYPAEKVYRHSLAEETQSLRVALSTLKMPPEQMDTTWRAVWELDHAGMLECWILLDHADQGIAQDYVVYRAAHRDLLHAYIAKYEVHPN